MNKIQIVINYFFTVLGRFIFCKNFIYTNLFKYFILFSLVIDFVQFYCEFESRNKK